MENADEGALRSDNHQEERYEDLEELGLDTNSSVLLCDSDTSGSGCVTLDDQAGRFGPVEPDEEDEEQEKEEEEDEEDELGIRVSLNHR